MTTAAPHETPRTLDRRTLLLLFAGALVLRLVFMAVEPATGPVADERTWLRWGVDNLASERVGLSPFRTRIVFHPPLYPYYVAIVWRLFGTLTAVKIAQAVAGAALVPAVALVGARVAGGPVGLAAGLITALFPEWVWYSVHFWSEPLFLSLLWWGFERVLAADAKGSTARALAAGFILGLASLARETALYFVPLAALWLILPRGPWKAAEGGSRRAAALLLATILTVAPWTIRNWMMFDTVVPVSTMGGLNLWQGNSGMSRTAVYERYFAIPGRIAQFDFGRAMGIRSILDRQPGWVFEKVRDEMPRFWGVDSFVWIHVKRGAYGAVGAPTQVGAALVIVAPYLLVLALAVWGTARARLDRPHLLLLVFFIYYVSLHVITYGYSRFRVPLMPVLFVLAAEGWRAWRDRAAPPLGRRRTILAAALALVFAAWVTPSLLTLGRVATEEVPEGGTEDPSAEG